MFKSFTYSTLISLICVTSLYTMDEPFMCKVPSEQAQITQSKELTKIASSYSQEQEFKRFADRWGWNVSIEKAGRLIRLREKFRKKYNLCVLHPDIEEEVHKAFKACNITEPIIVLQDENSTNSACYPLVDEWAYPVKAMAVGIADEHRDAPLSYIRHSIFHECGHIVAGDVDQHIKSAFAHLFAFGGASIYAGIRAAKALKSYSLGVRTIGGVGAGFAGFFGAGLLYGKTIHAYQTRKIERNADIFAAQKLIALNDYNSLIITFLNYTYNHDEGKPNWKNEYWLFHDHPGYFERARIILDELKKAHVDMNKLPIDEREHSDKQEIQQRFITQVKKHFPEYLVG